jgi:hypothetical protein
MPVAPRRDDGVRFEVLTHCLVDRHWQNLRLAGAPMATHYVERLAIELATGDRVRLLILYVSVIDLQGYWPPAGSADALNTIVIPEARTPQPRRSVHGFLEKTQLQLALQVGLQFLARDPPGLHPRVDRQEIPKSASVRGAGGIRTPNRNPFEKPMSGWRAGASDCDLAGGRHGAAFSQLTSSSSRWGV